MEEWFNAAHETIVKGFTDLTTQKRKPNGSESVELEGVWSGRPRLPPRNLRIVTFRGDDKRDCSDRVGR